MREWLEVYQTEKSRKMNLKRYFKKRSKLFSLNNSDLLAMLP